MGVKVAGSDMAPVSLESVPQVDNSVLQNKENRNLDKESRFKEPITFSSHGEEPVKVDRDDVVDSKLPKDAVDEWPAPKQIYTFYFIRYRPYDDPKLKTKIYQAGREIQKCNQSRYQITEELKGNRLMYWRQHVACRLASCYALEIGQFIAVGLSNGDWTIIPMQTQAKLK